MEWESKAQNFLIAIIVAAIFNFLIGAAMGPRNEIESAQGFVGLDSECKKFLVKCYGFFFYLTIIR